jgi:aspartyl/asparaginyl beta-hydroxylase (cupin superfamily)
MEIKWMFGLNFIILPATFPVADIIFIKTKNIQKNLKENRLSARAHLLGVFVEAHPNFGGQREAS